MPNVIFVAPFFLEATLRFVDAVAGVSGARVGLISQDSPEKLPPVLRSKISAHYQVRDGLDPQQIADAVRGLSMSIGAPSRLIGTLEQLQVPLAQVRSSLGIAGMGVEAAENFRDKARMKTVLRSHGLPAARHTLASSVAEARAFAGEVGFPIVVKPQAGAGAVSTFRLDGWEDLDGWLQTAAPRGNTPAMMEEFITGSEHSFDSVFVSGRLAWYSISRYYPTPLEVLRNPWIQWAVLLPREIDTGEFDDIRELGDQALRVLGMDTGLSHMEWFRRSDGSVAISEVAARPPGAQITSLLSYAHDVDMYATWAHLMVYDEFRPPERLFASGAVYLRGQGSGRVAGVHGLEEAQQQVGHLVVEAELPKRGQMPTGTYEGEGYVIVRHPETRVVEEALLKLVSVLRVELEE